MAGYVVVSIKQSLFAAVSRVLRQQMEPEVVKLVPKAGSKRRFSNMNTMSARPMNEEQEEQQTQGAL